MDARAERDLVCRLRRPRVCVSRRRRGRDRMGARRVRGGGRHHPDRARHPPAVEHGGSRLVTPVKLYGRPGSPQAHAIRDFLYRSDVPFEWIEHEKDTPVCVFSDGTRLENPTIRQIVEKLGWFRDPSRSEYDVAIYGAGPAGLSAAVTITNCTTGKTQTINTHWLFVCIGGGPHTAGGAGAGVVRD